eukprot:CAMPEP_0178464984 /NCGR_PEP_ID=MMETSP0689_2-20121128/51122_1 /TAXON_ID=160604 /ORGANISM="Amphidinium massartii, Strain CS-259" /LENGTH=788 /DNA_ID=CAMNT_0020091899 /DNA_START=162 /DNA_END=2525 /DNA_ORIENTATION=-
MENDGTKLWADQHSDPMNNLDYVEASFQKPPRFVRLLLTAKTGGSVLGLETFTEAFKVAEDIQALVAKGKGFSDLCLRTASQQCLGIGVLRFFNSSLAIFNSQVTNNAALLAAINRPTFPDDGSRVFPSDIMGGIQQDSNGNIVEATAMRLDFFIDGEADEDTNLEWELEVQDYFVDPDTGRVAQTYESVNIFVQAFRSSDDELARTVGGDVPIFAGAFVLMSVFCSLLLGKPCSWTQGRRFLGFLDFLLVLQGCLGGYGIAMLTGSPFTVLQQILPFILVGIGIDDAFVITNAYDATDASLPIPDRIELAMNRVGVSITLTSLTDIAAFLLGATSAFPAVQYFCIYAAFSCFFVWLLHCTSYCALLAMDAKRASADPPGATQGPTPGTKSNLSKFLGGTTRVLVGNPVGIIVTIVIFFSIAAISAWQIGEGLGTEFKLIDLTPDESFLRDFYNEEQKHFGGIPGGLGIPTALYVRNVDFASLEVQRNIEEAGGQVLGMNNIKKDAGLTSWHAEFSVWAWSNQGSLAVLPPSAFQEVPDGPYRSGCEAGLPAGVTECTSHFLTGPTFASAVQYFLQLPQYGRFEEDVIFDSDGNIVAARQHAQHTDSFGSEDQVDALEEAESLSDRWQGDLPGCFVLSEPYIFWDQFRIIVTQMLTSVIACLIAVMIISAFVLAHPLAVLIVLVVLVLVFVDLMGNIMVWGLDLNSISMINLVMAVGLVVDYSMHVVHNFMLQDNSLPRSERAVKAMEEIGPAVFLGVSTTFVSILPLALSTSQIFRVFFKMFFGIVV